MSRRYEARKREESKPEWERRMDAVERALVRVAEATEAKRTSPVRTISASPAAPAPHPSALLSFGAVLLVLCLATMLGQCARYRIAEVEHNVEIGNHAMGAN